jgi:hypothetical protein
MELPEPVKTVRLGDNFMFHWGKKPPGGLRADTATYPWLAKVVHDAVSNPYAMCRKGPNMYQIVHTVDPPSSQYLTIRHVVFPLKYVARSNARSPELWLITWFPLSSEKNVQKISEKCKNRQLGKDPDLLSAALELLARKFSLWL